MEAEKLETFVDAVLAIILTIIVLELPQPEIISFEGVLGFKNKLFCLFNKFYLF